MMNAQTAVHKVPECQKINNGGLDQYGPERFGRLIFATIGKMWE